jgi:hypothetical protein
MGKINVEEQPFKSLCFNQKKDLCMTECFEKIIELEIDFYNNFPEYKEELLEQMRYKQAIQYPVTHFDEEQGRVYLSCSGTEEQALQRIEAKEATKITLKFARKRIQRLHNAISQLEKDERYIIQSFYFWKMDPYKCLNRFSQFKTVQDFMKAKEQVLKKLFSIYEEERAAEDEEYRIIRMQELKVESELRKERRRKERLRKRSTVSLSFEEQQRSHSLNDADDSMSVQNIKNRIEKYQSLIAISKEGLNKEMEETVQPIDK